MRACAISWLSLLCVQAQTVTPHSWIETLRSTTASARLANAYNYQQLAGISDPNARSQFYAAVSDSDPYVRAHVIAALGELRTDVAASLPVLKRALLDKDEAVRLQAAIALSKSGDDAIPLLVEIVRNGTNAFPDKSGEAQYLKYANCGNEMYVPSFLAAFALGRIGPRATPALLKLLKPETVSSDDTTSKSQEKRPSQTVSLEQAIREGLISISLGGAYSSQSYLDLAFGTMGEAVLPEIFAELEESSGVQRRRIIGLLTRKFESPTSNIDSVVPLLSRSDTFGYATNVLGQSGPAGLAYLRSIEKADESSQLALIDGLRRSYFDDSTVEDDLIKIGSRASSKVISRFVALALESKPIVKAETWSWLLNAAIDNDEGVRNAASNTLFHRGPAPREVARNVLPRVLDAFHQGGKRGKDAVRALTSLGVEASPATSELLARAMLLLRKNKLTFDESDELKECIGVLFDIAPAQEALSLAMGLIGSKSSERETAAFGAVDRLGPSAEPLLPKLSSFLASKEYWEQAQAAHAIVSIGPVGQGQLIAFCNMVNSPYRLASCQALASDLETQDSMRSVLSALREPKLGKEVMQSLISRDQQRFRYEDSDQLASLGVFESLRLEVKETLPAIRSYLTSADSETRELAIHTIARFGPMASDLAPTVVDMLNENLPSRDQAGLFNALRNLGTPALDLLARQLQQGRGNTRVLEAVESFGTSAATIAPTVLPYLRSEQAAVRKTTLAALGRMHLSPLTYTDAVVPVLKDADEEVRLQAAKLLLGTNETAIVKVVRAVLRQLLGSATQSIRLTAAETLSQVGAGELNDVEAATLTAIATDVYLARLLARVQSEFYDEHFKTCVSATIHSLPPFPWPPPQFSERDVIPRTFLASNEDTLSHVDQVLNSALQATGYGIGGLFSIPGGFVRVTRLERLDSELTPVSAEYRWTSAPMPPRNLLDYLGQLFLETPGVYRFIAFAVTDTWSPPSQDKLSYVDAEVLFLKGRLTLPDEYKEMKFAGRECYVLIYQFEKLTGRSWQVIPSPLDAKTQLIRSGLWSKLGGK